MKVRSRKLPEECKHLSRISFFRKAKNFKKHLRKHFLSRHEPWANIVNKGTRKLLEKAAKTAEIQGDLLQSVYDRVYEVIYAGVCSSVEMPIYIISDQEISYLRKNGTRKGYRKKSATFLASAGYTVVAHKLSGRKYHVVTAYCHCNSKSEFVRFNKARRQLMLKYSKDEYKDTAGNRIVKNRKIKFISKKNWKSSASRR